MESNKQEKSNLLNDNPIARRAGGSWISKHSIAAGSPLHKGGSALYQERPDPSTLINAKAGYNAANKSLTDFQNTFKDATFGSQGEVDTYNNEQSRLLNATNERADAYNKSNDSISNVNKAYNKKVTAYNNSIAPTEMKGSALNQNAAARVKADNERIAKAKAVRAKKAAELKAKQDKERKERGTKSKARLILEAVKNTMTDKTSKV